MYLLLWPWTERTTPGLLLELQPGNGASTECRMRQEAEKPRVLSSAKAFRPVTICSPKLYRPFDPFCQGGRSWSG